MRGIHLILAHSAEAGIAAVLFFIGALLAPIVYSRRMETFIAFPRWLMRKLRSFIAEEPSIPQLALLIFAFNGSAILLYMLSGVVPGVPLLIALGTGLNVALAGFLAHEERPATGPAARPLPFSVRLCAALTFLLELPCFWYAIGMGFRMPTALDLLHGGDPNAIARRVSAYVMFILPTLLVSATVESYAVLWAARHASEST